jgi:hypothetical protein
MSFFSSQKWDTNITNRSSGKEEEMVSAIKAKQTKTSFAFNVDENTIS